VRGKIIMSLALAFVMLFGAIQVSHADPIPTTTLSINPSEITLLPGESFEISVDITDVADLYTWAFELHYAPFGNLLAFRIVREGPFLGQDGMETDFSYSASTLDGVVKVGSTRLGQVSGASGSGTLATLEFVVVEGGGCDLTLMNTRLIKSISGKKEMIPHNIVNSLFNGGHGEASAFLTGVRGDSATAHVGDTITLSSSVTHVGAEIPVSVRVRYDLVRKDGYTLTFWTPSPRTYELPVDGFTADFTDWGLYGTGPYLDAVGDGNYVENPYYCAIVGLFSFADLPALGPGEYVSSVSLYAFTSAQNPEIDGDVYVFNDITEWWWSGSIETGPAWGWAFTEYASSLDDVMYDEATINSASVLIHYWTPDGSEGPTMAIDAMKLVVETNFEFLIGPGESVDMPLVTYTLTEADKGVYRVVTATVWCTAYVRNLWNAFRPQTVTVIGEVTPRTYLIVNP
jgi:hypothetical protein